RQSSDVGPGQLHLAGTPHEAGDGVDERGLARTVRADKTDQLTVAHLHRDLTQRVHAAERDGQAGDAQHGGAAREIGWSGALFAGHWNRSGRLRGADHGSLVYPPVDVAGHARWAL